MQSTTATFLGSEVGTRLIAAVLALAGSGAMVGGNLGIVAHYAATAGSAQSLLASGGDTSRHIARITCTSNAS
jgi:hypothetical protein